MSELAVPTQVTPAQQALIDQLQLSHVPPAQLAAFLYTAKTLGLDPRLGEITLIERNDYQRGKSYTVQVGISGYRKAARRIATEQGVKLGVSAPEYCGTDGVWKDVWLAATPPAACRVTVLRDGEPFTKTILWREYAALKKDGTPMALWASKPTYMLAKTAESLAYRMAFPDFNGTYEPAEFDQEDILNQQQQPTRVQAQRMDTPQAEPDEETQDMLLAIEASTDTDTLRDLWKTATGYPAEQKQLVHAALTRKATELNGANNEQP